MTLGVTEALVRPLFAFMKESLGRLKALETEVATLRDTLASLEVEPVSERSFTIKSRQGSVTHYHGTITFPVDIYRGVFVEGKTYQRGDCTTWAGSEWHCNETTTNKPGDGSKAWTLKVKKGRDGKDAAR